MELDSLINSMKIKYINNLISNSHDVNNTSNLQNILDKTQTISFSETQISELSETTLTNNTNIDEYSDDYLYKKPWSKLGVIHKVIKMKEFVKKLIIHKDEDREKLKDSLINLINTKVLTKKDMVKYDIQNGRIIGIPNLNFSEGKYFFLI
jgi:hypothetical protein